MPANWATLLGISVPLALPGYACVEIKSRTLKLSLLAEFLWASDVSLAVADRWAWPPPPPPLCDRTTHDLLFDVVFLLFSIDNLTHPVSLYTLGLHITCIIHCTQTPSKFSSITPYSSRILFDLAVHWRKRKEIGSMIKSPISHEIQFSLNYRNRRLTKYMQTK